jgi:putative membrane protein
MMWWNDGMSSGSWIAMTLIMIAFWALLIAGLMAIFRGAGEASPATQAHGRAPQEILDERFARGEIDADEYLARQDALRANH